MLYIINKLVRKRRLFYDWLTSCPSYNSEDDCCKRCIERVRERVIGMALGIIFCIVVGLILTNKIIFY